MDILNALGKPLRLSASAADTWLDCKRKWAYGYYWRVARVSSPAAEIGNKVHDLLENWLVIGEKPEDPNNRYWRIAEAGMQFLPEVITDSPNPGNNGVVGNWQIEEWVKCQCGPLPFVGKVDLYNLTDFDNIQVDDHKTTGDSSWRWAKTPRQLAKLLQPHAYAWSLIQVHGLNPPESVDFRHIYYATKGEPKAMEVRARNVPWEDIEKTWRQLEAIAYDMASTVENIVEPEDVEVTTSSCRKYGGCPYADRCSASPLNRNKPETKPVNIERDEKMSDRLSALRAQLGLNKNTNTQVVSPVRAAIATPTVEDPQGDVQSLADKLTRAIDGGTTIPIAAAEAMARSAEVYLYEAMELANLMNVNGFLVPKALTMKEADTVTAEAREEEHQAAAAARQAEIDAQHAAEPEPTGLEILTASRGDEVAQVLTRWHEYLIDNNNRMHRKDAQAIVREATGAQRVRKERILEYIKQFNEAYMSATIRLQGHMIIGTPGYQEYVEKDPEYYEKLNPLGLPNTSPSGKVYPVKPAKDSEATPSLTPVVASESNALLPTPEPQDTPLGRIVKEVATPTIYIDCIPEDPAGVYSFTDFVREYEMEVEKEGGKVNETFTQPLPYYGLVDYGQGPKRVAGKVLAALHRAGPQILKGDMYVDGKHPLADEIIPILRRLKGVRVVRASR